MELGAGPAGQRISVDPVKIQAFKDYIKGERVVTAATDNSSWNPDFLPFNISVIDAGDHNSTATDEKAKSKLLEKLQVVDMNSLVLDEGWTSWSTEYIPFALRADNPSAADILFAKYGEGIIFLTTLDTRNDG